jgi:phosphohistidine phosphatase
MIKLYILRHGEAVEAEVVGGKDEARVLSAKGEESVHRAAKGMRALEVKPEAIWTSPLPRAAQTARITAEVLGCPEAVKDYKHLEQGADPGVLAGLIQSEAANGSIMLVGHNPDLEELVQYLISETDQANVVLRKGGLAILEAERPIHQGCAGLLSLWTPKQLAKVAD